MRVGKAKEDLEKQTKPHEIIPNSIEMSMSELLDLQKKFTLMTAKLIEHAYSLGYELTYGDAYRDPRVPYGHPDSQHRRRLAVDFNLFINGQYMKSTNAHRPLGEFWESIGGTWGGRFDDGNHYSLAWRGMK